MVPVLNDVAVQVFGRDADSLALPPDAAVCLPCLRSVDKLVKLREDLRAQESEIHQQVRRAGESIGMQTSGVQAAETLGSPLSRRQRPVTSTHVDLPTPDEGVMSQSTPVRKARSSRLLAQGNSPAVAASTRILCSLYAMGNDPLTYVHAGSGDWQRE